jgi:hypothetical protein
MPIKVAAPVKLTVPSLWAQRIAVPQFSQEQSEWCWAACAQMVLRYYGNNAVRQCDVAARLFGQPGCSENPSSSLCNEPAQVQDIAGVYSDWGRPTPQYVNGSVPFKTLQSELNAKHPVEVGFIWKDGTGHQVIICGWNIDTTGPLLLVNDPRWGSGGVYYTNLVLAYGWGSWQDTWISLA